MMSQHLSPRLETERLILRVPEPADFDACAAFLTDRDRAWGFGAEENRTAAWRWFSCNLGHWAWHGYGYFTMHLKETGAPCGLTGIWNPEGWPEPEIGWVVYEGYEGKGLALEGATRARAWAYLTLGFTTLTSNILPGNTRSEVLARRMGAWFERCYENVHMGTEQLFRHPSPADLGLDPERDGSPEACA